MARDLIASVRLPDALDTLQMLAVVAHDRVCVVEGAAPKATIAEDRRAGLAHALRLPPADLGVVDIVVEPPPPLAPEPSPLAPDEAARLALFHRLPSWVRALFRRRLPDSVTPTQEPVRC